MAPAQTTELSNKEEIYQMQKKLIAAAVAGLIAVPALAQTNVTISGRFAAGYDNYKLSGGAAGGHDTYNGFSDQSSRIIFNVTEDLGGGLKAWAQLDQRFDPTDDVGTTNAGGNSGLGLMGSWGKFTLGRWDVHYTEIAGGTNAGTRAGSLEGITSFGLLAQVNGAASVRATRTNNLIMWDSPNWNGFTGRLMYSTAPFGVEGGDNRAAGNPGDGSAWSGAVRYANGPWKAGLSYWKADAEGAALGAGDQRSTRLWGSYMFGMGLSIGLGYDRSSLDGGATTSRRTAWYIPINYAFGPHKVYFDYARANDASNTPAGNTSANQWMLGYDYAFSKRTSAGVYYTKINNSRAGAYSMFHRGAEGATLVNLAGEDSRQIYIGMAHNF
ncbi:MAG: porin [Rhodocyclaceae bacterium]|nr:porin [Rhodocyclaceae bacterium]